MNLLAVFSIAGVVVGIAGIAGAALMQGSLGEARRRITDLTAERDDYKRKYTETNADLTALQRIVTGEVHWQELVEMVMDLLREVREMRREIVELRRGK